MTPEQTKYLPPELVKAWELCEKLKSLPWHHHEGIGELLRCQNCTDRQTAWTELMDESRTALYAALSLVIKMGKADEQRAKDITRLTIERDTAEGALEKKNEEFKDAAILYGNALKEIEAWKGKVATAEATIAELRGDRDEWKRTSLALVTLLRAKCSEKEWCELAPRFSTALYLAGAALSEQVGGK